MDQLPEFDKYAGIYEEAHKFSTRSSGFEPSYFDEYKVREVDRVLAARNVAPRTILNFGCGIGKSEGYFHRFFPTASVLGVDVSPKSIEMAVQRNAGLDSRAVRFLRIRSVAEIPGRYEVIFVANVFHHVDHVRHVEILEQLRTKLDPQGYLFLFEHNPYNPITLKAVRDCEFDADAHLLNPGYARHAFQLAGFNRVSLRYTLFFPHFLKALIPAERFLYWLPLGAQYFCIAWN